MEGRIRPEPLTTLACIVCVFIWGSLALQPQHTDALLARFGALTPEQIWDGRYWGLLTSPFVHIEIWHLAFNVYWLWTLGNIMEREVGPLYYFLFFAGAAFVSSAAQLMTGLPGIGMSGVIYGLFGFGWLARPWMPAFAAVLESQTVKIFLVWLVGCWIATELHFANIGNEAHLGGLLFGTGIAGIFVRRWRLPLLIPGMLLLIALSVLPLFWVPWSGSWTAYRGVKEHRKGHYAAAIRWYRQSLALGEDPAWAWRNIAYACAAQGDWKGMARALDELDKADPESARAAKDELSGSGDSKKKPAPQPEPE